MRLQANMSLQAICACVQYENGDGEERNVYLGGMANERWKGLGAKHGGGVG